MLTHLDPSGEELDDRLFEARIADRPDVIPVRIRSVASGIASARTSGLIASGSASPARTRVGAEIRSSAISPR